MGASVTEPTNLTLLVLRAQKGERQAFEDLFYATHRLARKIALSVVGPDSVDDAVQESYLLVFRKLPQLRDPGAFRGWLSRLVLHTCYRMKERLPDTAPMEELEATSKESTDQIVDTLTLRQGLMRLKKKDRDILVLRELLGLSYEEVSVAMSLALGTVRSRLHSARKKLGERLKT